MLASGLYCIWVPHHEEILGQIVRQSELDKAGFGNDLIDWHRLIWLSNRIEKAMGQIKNVKYDYGYFLDNGD
jgi:hypothetical protein